MNLNLSSYRWVSRSMSITASNSGTIPRACIHRSAFYHNFTGSILARSTSCSDSGTIPCCFCSNRSSADPYFCYTFSYRSTDGSSHRTGICHFCNYSPPLDVNGSCILSSISSNCCTISGCCCFIEHLYGARLFRLTVNRKLCILRHTDAGRGNS